MSYNFDQSLRHAGPVGASQNTIGAYLWLSLEIGLALLLVLLLAIEGQTLDAGTAPLWIVLTTALFPIISVVLQSIIERVLPAGGPRKSFRGWLLHLQINAFFWSVSSVAAVAAFLGCSALARHFGFKLGLIDIRVASGRGLFVLIASLWLASILSDFFFYWYHRWTHENKFLWQHHKMHHTDRELEAISTARQNWVEAVFNGLFVAAPMILLFKLDPLDQWNTGIVAGVTAGFLNNLLTLSHMNIRCHVGWFNRFWCSPQNHRIHHSLEPKHFDKNYAFIFPMWDVLFGTYWHPRKGEYPETGVANENGFSSFWEAEIYSQREWWKFIKNRRARATVANS